MFDLWETAIVDVVNSYMINKFSDIKVNPVNDPVGDMALIFPDKKEMRWEIKSSQALNSFTGATHSASKCNNYILINYAINRNMKLKSNTRNKGFITEIAVFVWDKMNIKWLGKPSEHSSFTSLKIPAKVKTKRKDIIVIGDLEPKTKWCNIIRKKINLKILLSSYLEKLALIFFLSCLYISD